MELTDEQHRAIRHMPMVVAHITAKAEEMLGLVDAMCLSELTSKRWKNSQKMGHFDVVVSDSPDNTRPRAYVHPIDSKGIHIEMTHHVLLKAAAAMAGR
jgi:hypothetical protein